LIPAYMQPLRHSSRYRNQGRDMLMPRIIVRSGDGAGGGAGSPVPQRFPLKPLPATSPRQHPGSAGHSFEEPPMRMDKLNSRFQQALADAQSLAVGRDHNLLEPVHVLTALLDQSGGSTMPLLAQAGVNVPLLRERLGEAMEKLPKVSGQAGNLSIGNDLGRLFNLTDRLAQQNGDQFIASEWFVMAALEDTGAAGQALK